MADSISIFEEYKALTPERIIDGSRQEILSYLDAIKGIYHKYLGAWENTTNGMTLNHHILREAVESCICDLYRLKFFRNVRFEDNHKRAAFFMIWLAKIRPVQITGPVEKKTHYFANEWLAVAFAFNILDISPKNIDVDYLRNTLNLLHFRSCDAERLASELFLLEQLLKGSPVQ